MAEKKKRTLRSKAEQAKTAKPSRKSTFKKKLGKPFRKAARVGGKEYRPLQLPDNKAGRILNKRVRFVPKYFKESWQEIRQVTWPNRRETWRLTLAVLIFSIIFTAIVAVLDAGLDKLFKEIIVQ